MNTERTLNAAKDTIKQFLARRYPLKNVASDIIAARKLNSRERRALLDWVFRFCREIFLFEQFVKTSIPFSQSMSTQEKNMLLLDVMVHGQHKNFALLAKDYQTYVNSLGDERYLLALSPLVRDALRKDYGHDATTIAKSLSARSAKYLAYDRTRVSQTDVVNALHEQGVQTFLHPRLASVIGTHDEIRLDNLPKELHEHVWFMDAGSQIIAELIAPRPSHRVLDMCTGEGNKARYITMHDCDYVAADIDGARLKKAQTRLAHKNIQFVVGDARSLFEPESFDWILLDAPCSGTGVLRRHPDLMHRLTAKAIDDSVQLQRELLDRAITLLRPDGVLIYATCSLFAVENHQQINRCLEKNSSRVEPYALRDLAQERIVLNADERANHSMMLLPHIDDCDGFYFAALKKLSHLIV